MKQTQTRRLSPRRALSAQMNEAPVAYDHTILHRAAAAFDQIRKVLDGREESRTSN